MWERIARDLDCEDVLDLGEVALDCHLDIGQIVFVLDELLALPALHVFHHGVVHRFLRILLP